MTKMNFGNCKLSDIGSAQSNGEPAKSGGGMLASVVTKTVQSGLNPETSTHWLVTWASLSLSVCFGFPP